MARPILFQSGWRAGPSGRAHFAIPIFDATQRVASLKIINHDMVSHIGKAKAAVEELKSFFVTDSLEDINKKLDKFYMVLILRSLHSTFDHVCDQVLASDQIPSMDNLVTRLLRVPTLVKDESSTNIFETSAMVAPRGRGGGQSNCGASGGRVGILNAHIVIEWAISKTSFIPYMVFLIKLLMCPSLII